MEKLIRVIIQRPMTIPRVTKIEPTLTKFREIVGGDIEAIRIPNITDKGITCFANMDGKRLMLTQNFALITDGKIYDMLLGTALFVRHDKNGNPINLTDDDIKTVVVNLKLMELMR